MTTYGNVDEGQAFENSQVILNAAERRDVSIFRLLFRFFSSPTSYYFSFSDLICYYNKFQVHLYRGTTSPFTEGFPSDHHFGNDGLGDNGKQSFKALKAQKEHAALALLELSKKHKSMSE